MIYQSCSGRGFMLDLTCTKSVMFISVCDYVCVIEDTQKGERNWFSLVSTW